MWARAVLPVLFGAFFAATGCVQIDGGAVEVRWDIQYGGQDCTSGTLCRRGNRITCETAQVEAVKLKLTPNDALVDPCEDTEKCRFVCDRKVGTTTFFIPEGEYAMSLVVLDENGTEIGTEQATVSAPLVRQVREGELTNLNVNLIIVTRCKGCQI
jgi:hypothetical protein